MIRNVQIWIIAYVLLGVESDLPEDLKKEAQLSFEAAVSNRMNIGDSISKVQKEVLSKCDERFKGQRYKGFIKFDYDSNIVSITVCFALFLQLAKVFLLKSLKFYFAD